MSLNEIQFMYILNCNSTKEMWDTLEMKGGNVYNFQGNPKKEEIIEKINELIQLLQDERMISNLE